jgi:hypothetical protein
MAVHSYTGPLQEQYWVQTLLEETVPRRKKPAIDDYRRIRKPMPPPERVDRDRRSSIARRQAKQDVDEAMTEQRKGPRK